MINFKGVSKKYPNTTTLALNSMSFNIHANEIVCFLGPNGAGKTTLIKCFSGLIIPDSGEIYLNNKSITADKKYISDVSVLLEGARNLYWRATVKSNFYYFAALKGVKKEHINKNLAKYEKLFNISSLLDKQVGTLSLGQKQKVAILTAILLDSKVIILDEPSNGLDIEAKENLAMILNSIRKESNKTIIIASHDIDFVRKIVDKFIIIDKGTIKKELVNRDLTNEDIERYYFDNITTCEGGSIS